MLCKKITVIVPIYNAERYLSKCVKSILNQTYTNLQIILVDDGSADNSGEICDWYAKTDERIKVFHTSNKGLVAARKLGIRHAEGEYIGFVDADDYIEADMYEVLYQNISENDADFVHAGYIEENGEGNKAFKEFEQGVFELKSIKERKKFLVEYVLRAEGRKFITYSIWSKLYKTDLIKNSYFMLQDGQQYGEDLFNLCLCILKSRRIVLVKAALYHYMVRVNSLSHLQGTKYLLKELELSTNLVKVIQEYDEQVYSDLEPDICCYIKNKLVNALNGANEKRYIQRFYFKDVKMLRGKKIALYGAGTVGRDYYEQFCKYNDIEIAAWFDLNWEECKVDYFDIKGIDSIWDYNFDEVVIAVYEESLASEIEAMLLKYGQLKEKVIWKKPRNLWEL